MVLERVATWSGADREGRRIGLTQPGSTFHHHLGNILETEGRSLDDAQPFGGIAEAASAHAGRAVTALGD